MSDELFRLVYVSQASHEMSDIELVELLNWSRRWNQTVGITGALVYHQQRFLQVLEGDEDLVEGLFGRICSDARNHSQMVIFQEAAVEREFGTWSMGWVPGLELREEGFDLRLLDSADTTRGALSQIFTAFRKIGRLH